jgi:hypothetical protein
MYSRAEARPVIAGLLVGALLVVAGGCSSAPPAARQPRSQSVAGTSWIGSCAGYAVGTFTFEFDSGNGVTGTVRVGFPDARGTQAAGYSTPPTNGQPQQLTIDLAPPWQGPFVRDLRSLRWDFVVAGTGQGGRCELQLAQSGTV